MLFRSLSVRQKVCIVHCGEGGKEWRLLHDRLRRIDFLADDQLGESTDLGCYSSILVDESHLLSPEKMSVLLTWSERRPVIFSSDSEDVISPEELDRSIVEGLGKLPGIQKFHLTNRIRTNASERVCRHRRLSPIRISFAERSMSCKVVSPSGMSEK